MDIIHKIYHLTFPCSNTYVGSTSKALNIRYSGYRGDAERSKSPICQISLKYKFEEVKMVEVDRIECSMKDPKIRMLEEKWIKKLNPTLNIYKAHQTKEEERIRDNEWYREFYKTPQGKRSLGINNAKENIKRYTKQNRPDMVLRWEGRLKERIEVNQNK